LLLVSSVSFRLSFGSTHDHDSAKSLLFVPNRKTRRIRHRKAGLKERYAAAMNSLDQALLIVEELVEKQDDEEQLGGPLEALPEPGAEIEIPKGKKKASSVRIPDQPLLCGYCMLEAATAMKPVPAPFLTRREYNNHFLITKHPGYRH